LASLAGRPAAAIRSAFLLAQRLVRETNASEADIRLTRDLIQVGRLIKIEVLDHVIVGRATTDRPRDYTSLREMGFFC